MSPAGITRSTTRICIGINKMVSNTDNKKRNFMRDLACVLIITIATFIWYQSNSWSVLMGDDLIAVTGFKNLGFWGNLFNLDDVAMGKIRPIQKAMLYIIYAFCGVEYKAYYVVSRIFVAIAACISYFCTRKINGNRLLAVCVSVLVITCPFSAYGAWQYIGVSESFSLICSILYGVILYQIIDCENNKKILNSLILASVILALLVFNAERFMYLAAVAILVICFHHNSSWFRKILYCVISAWPIILRSVLLKSLGSVSLGTGRADFWTLLSTLFPCAIKGYINMLGFSIGDDWHGGFSIVQLSPWILILSSVRLFIFMGVLFDVGRLLLIERNKKYWSVIVWYIFSLTSLFSYALVGSTHGEDRFLWIPYVFYLFAIVDYVTKMGGDKKEKSLSETKDISRCLRSACAISVCLILIASNYYYFNVKTHVHFRYSQEIAESAKESIESLNGYKNVENIAFVNKNDYLWVFYENSFTSFYISDSANSFYYNSADELDADRETLGENTIVIYPDLAHSIPYGAKAYWINDFYEE
jgi:hypothetical protein